MRKRLFIFLVIFGFLASCSMFQVEKVEDIKVVVKKIRMVSMDQRRVILEVTVDITNPNSYEVILNRAESDIYVNGTYLAHAISPQAVVINKSATDVIEIGINYRDVISTLENYDPKKKITCRAESILYFQLPQTFEKRKIYTKRMVIEKDLPALSEMIQKGFEISF
ncbi:MAG: LEA type 2 family protein [Spirochaetota bacterium]